MSERRPDSSRRTLGWTAALLLGSYPPWWRLRYDDEMRDTVLALRDEGHWNAASARDLLRGVVAAWLAPTQVPSSNTVLARQRRLLPCTAWGLLIFVLAGSAFAKVIEDPAFAAAGRRHAALSWCVTSLMVAAIAAAVVMALASTFSIVAVLRHGHRTRWRTLIPLLVAPASLGVFALTVAVTRSVADDSPAHAVSQGAAFGTLVLVLVAGGVATTIAVMRVAVRVPDAPGVAINEQIATVGVAVFTTISAIVTLLWTLVAAAESPSLLHSHDGVLGTSTSLSVVMVLIGLAASALLCGRSAVATMQARH